MKSKRALYNIISEFIYEAISIISSFILPRLILKTYGSEYNGLVLSITQFLGYVSILTLGISGSTRIAIYRAKSDNVKISKVVKATQNYMKKISYFYLFYSVALAVLYPIIVQTSLDWYKVSLLVLIIGIGVFFEYSFGVTYKALTSAMQCQYINNIILIVLKLLSTSISVLLIINNNNIFVVKLLGSICFALGPILLNYFMSKKFNIIKNVNPDPDALKQKKDVMAHSVANCVHQYTDIFLLSIFTNVMVISVYSIYNLILSGITKIQTMFTNGLEGAFGQIWANGDNEKFKKNFTTFEFLNFSLVSIISTCTTLLLIPFVGLYTKGVKDINYIIPTFAYLSILTSMSYCIRTPYLIAVQSAGMYKETRNGAILEAVFNFIISIILVKPFGLIGVTIGTLFANTFRTVQYENFVSKKLILRSNLEFVKRILWLLFCFISMILIITVLPKLGIISWTTWFLSAIYYFMLSFSITVALALIFYRDDFNNSIILFKTMLKRRSRHKK